MVSNAAHLDAPPRPRATPAAASPTAAARIPSAPRAASPLAHMPTPEQIAAEVRRRPIGAVIADICLDLGITPSHSLWRDVQMAIFRHGGSYAGLFKDIMRQMFQPLVTAAAPAISPATSPPPSPAGTGPPPPA